MYQAADHRNVLTNKTEAVRLFSRHDEIRYQSACISARETQLPGSCETAGAASRNRSREWQAGPTAKGRRQEVSEERRQVMAVYKRGKIWWYKFNWNGEPI